MPVTIRRYRPSDRDFLELCEAELQDHVARLDPWKMVARSPGFARSDVRIMLGKVRKHYGTVLVALVHGRPVGFTGGWIAPVSRHQSQGELPNRTGYVSDLVVLTGWRDRGIGTQLLNAIERRFKEQGCDTVSIGVFHANTGAKRLYLAQGFSPRSLWLAKRIGKAPATWKEAKQPPERPRSRHQKAP